jgi:hypothetical protein
MTEFISVLGIFVFRKRPRRESGLLLFYAVGGAINPGANRGLLLVGHQLRYITLETVAFAFQADAAVRLRTQPSRPSAEPNSQTAAGTGIVVVANPVVLKLL